MQRNRDVLELSTDQETAQTDESRPRGQGKRGAWTGKVMCVGRERRSREGVHIVMGQVAGINCNARVAEVIYMVVFSKNTTDVLFYHRFFQRHSRPLDGA